MNRRIDRDAVAQDWANRGFSCDVWEDPPGQRWEDYVHPVDELLLLLEGELELELDGRNERLPVGRELCIPAGKVHSVRNVGDTLVRWLYGYSRPD